MPAKDRDEPTQVEKVLYAELLQRKDDGNSMNHMAEQSGVNVSIISRILSGARAGVSLHTAGLLCHYLGLKLGKPPKKS